MLKNRRRSFGVFARMRGQPEKTNELRQRLHELTSLTRAEKGCLSCEMIENPCDSTEFTLLEEWSSKEEHELHFGSYLIRNTMESFSKLLSEELNLQKYVLRLNTVKYGTNSYCLDGGGVNRACGG